MKDASIFSIVHVVCFLGGHFYSLLGSGVWAAQAPQRNFFRLPPAPGGATTVGRWPCLMLELSTSLSSEVRTRGTTDYALDTRGAVIATSDGDVYEELWSDYASLLLAGPRGGPPDPLRGRMLYRFKMHGSRLTFLEHCPKGSFETETLLIQLILTNIYHFALLTTLTKTAF